MTVTATQAARAYAATRPVLTPEATHGRSAAEAFTGVARDFLDTMRWGEETSRQALAGQADTQSLVRALAETELAIETAVAVRDKVVEAYQEILRMPV